MNAGELIQAIEADGGCIRADGADLMIAPKEAAAPLREELRRHKKEIIELLLARDLDLLWPHFCDWYDYSVRVETALGYVPAKRPPPIWSTAVKALHRDFVCWQLDRNQAPPTREQFVVLAHKLGCVFRIIAGEEFIIYAGLKSDIEANELFQRLPLPVPIQIPEPAPPPETEDYGRGSSVQDSQRQPDHHG